MLLPPITHQKDSFILLAKPTEQSLDSSNRLKQSCMLGCQHFKPERSVQAKNVFLSYGNTRVTFRNSLLNSCDEQRFISQTCFDCQFYCISFCVQLMTYYAKWKKPLECKFWHVFSLFYHPKESQKF